LKLTAKSFEAKAKKAILSNGSSRYDLNVLVNKAVHQLRTSKEHDPELAHQVTIAKELLRLELV